MSRTIIVGDIHGCLDELKALVAKLKLTSQDRFISCGDLVDRGPDSAGVIKYMRQNGFEAVAGNHDTKLVRYAGHVAKKKADPDYRFPMQVSEERDVTISCLDDDDLDWLANLPTFIRLPEHNTIIVHAGVLADDNVEKQSKEVLTMLRYVSKDTPHKMLSLITPGYIAPENSVYWTAVYRGHANIVFGHNVADLERPTAVRCFTGAMAYGIDTGVCFGGRLTAMVIDDVTGDQTFIQVKSNLVYSEYEVVRTNF